MLANFLLFFTSLMLLCGLGLSVGILQVTKLKAQHAADAAALGALYERARGSSQSTWIAAGKSDAGMNGFTDGTNGVTVTIVSPPTSGTYSGDSTAIQATVKQTVAPGFLGIFGVATPGAAAVSRTSANPDCTYVMGAGSWNYTLQNRGFSSFSSACNVYIDSTNYNLDNDWGSTISLTGSTSIKVQGTSSGAWLWGSTSPSPTFSSSNEDDPLSWETAPSVGGCTYTNIYLLFSTTTLNPGTYCNLTINASTVTFNPGLYILLGGSTWEGGSTITGTGVTFYLSKGSSWPWNSYNNFYIYNSTVTFSAPTSTAGGGLTGIVFFADRNWSNSGGQNLFIESSYVTTDGIWYAPNVGIYNSNSVMRGINYLGFVTDNFYFSGATITVPSPNYSSLSGGSPYLSGSSVGGIVQ